MIVMRLEVPKQVRHDGAGVGSHPELVSGSHDCGSCDGSHSGWEHAT